MALNTCSLAICLLILNFSQFRAISSFNELQFDSMQFLNSTYAEGLYNVSEMRVTKTNRTTYVVNIVWDLLDDFGDDMEMEIKFYYNRFNNNQYNLSPIRVPQSSFCSMKKFYPILFTEATKNTSNIFKANQSTCPYNKVRNYEKLIIHIVTNICFFFLGALLCVELCD